MPEESMPGRSAGPDARSAAGIDDSRLAPDRYDLLLAVVPVAFILGSAASLVGMPLQVAMLAAAAVGALALVDGLLLNPPRRPGTGSGRV